MEASKPRSIDSTQEQEAPMLMGGSTKMMLVRFELGRLKVNTEKVNPSNPYFIGELVVNAKIQAAQQDIEDTQKSRDSIFGVKSELEKLVPALTESPTIKPNDKKDLLQRATQLGVFITDAIKTDTKLAELATQLRNLESERLKQRKSNYAIIQAATNPNEKAKELLEKDRENTDKIENLQKEITSAIKLFEYAYKKIGQTYADLHGTVPGSLKLPHFHEIKKAIEPSEPEAPATLRAS